MTKKRSKRKQYGGMDLVRDLFRRDEKGSETQEAKQSAAEPAAETPPAKAGTEIVESGDYEYTLNRKR